MMAWDLGNTGQPDNGKGIDRGTYWQLDMTTGYTGTGNIPGATFNDDHYIVLPSGRYLLAFSAILETSASGIYRAALYNGGWGFPGPYQYSLPDFIQPIYQAKWGAIDLYIVCRIRISD